MLGEIGAYAGFALLPLVGILMIRSSLQSAPDREFEATRGVGLLMTSLSISLDSLGVRPMTYSTPGGEPGIACAGPCSIATKAIRLLSAFANEIAARGICLSDRRDIPPRRRHYNRSAHHL